MSHYDPIDASTRAHLARLPPWRKRKVLFLRAVAIFLLLQGLYHWASICGIWDSNPSHFEEASGLAQASVIWVAILCPIAGVGLWLGASWGVVLWLVGMFSQVVLNIWAPEGAPSLLVLTLFEVALVVAYAVLSIRAARESDEE